jgi:hypothetical protein
MGNCDSTKKTSGTKSIEESKIQNNLNTLLNSKDEMGFGHKSFEVEFIEKYKKSICKILANLKGINRFGTGFFMLYNNKKYLLTSYHIIDSNKLDINIELLNKKIIKLDLLSRNVAFFLDPIDITIIEIKDSDIFIKDINFLDYDFNYIKGIQQYNDEDILNIGYPNNKMSITSGKIYNIMNNEFFYKIYTKFGSSGSPIISLKTSLVIGIHKGVNNMEKLKFDTFIGEVINNLKKIIFINNENTINNNNLNNIEMEFLPFMKNNILELIYYVIIIVKVYMNIM